MKNHYAVEVSLLAFEEKRRNLVKRLERTGYIESKKVKRAFLRVPRHLFVPEHMNDRAYMDSPQPIGEGQTISAPHMVAMMVEKLELEEGHKVLEVGGGLGYHAAVMAEIVGEEGEIYSVERLPSLAESAKDILKRTPYDNVHIVTGDGSSGYEEEAPYDRISVACGSPDLPEPLIQQLKVDGKLLIPVGGKMFQSLVKVTKTSKTSMKKKKLGGVRFVPLKGKYGY